MFNFNRRLHLLHLLIKVHPNTNFDIPQFGARGAGLVIRSYPSIWFVCQNWYQIEFALLSCNKLSCTLPFGRVENWNLAQYSRVPLPVGEGRKLKSGTVQRINPKRWRLLWAVIAWLQYRNQRFCWVAFNVCSFATKRSCLMVYAHIKMTGAEINTNNLKWTNH